MNLVIHRALKIWKKPIKYFITRTFKILIININVNIISEEDCFDNIDHNELDEINVHVSNGEDSNECSSSESTDSIAIIQSSEESSDDSDGCEDESYNTEDVRTNHYFNSLSKHDFFF